MMFPILTGLIYIPTSDAPKMEFPVTSVTGLDRGGAHVCTLP